MHYAWQDGWHAEGCLLLGEIGVHLQEGSHQVVTGAVRLLTGLIKQPLLQLREVLLPLGHKLVAHCLRKVPYEKEDMPSESN